MPRQTNGAGKRTKPSFAPISCRHWGGSRSIKITSERIADLVAEMRSKGYTGGTTNRVLALLSHVFNLARKWSVAGAAMNPAAGIAAAPEAHRQRFLSLEETKRL